MIKEIAAFVASKAGLTVGVDLYVGWWPQDKPDACDLIAEYGGLPSFDLPGRFEAAIQITSRAKTYQPARARSYAIYEAICLTTLWVIPAITSGGRAYEATIEANNIPQYLGEDDKSRHEFVVNLLLHTKRTA